MFAKCRSQHPVTDDASRPAPATLSARLFKPYSKSPSPGARLEHASRSVWKHPPHVTSRLSYLIGCASSEGLYYTLRSFREVRGVARHLEEGWIHHEGSIQVGTVLDNLMVQSDLQKLNLHICVLGRSATLGSGVGQDPEALQLGAQGSGGEVQLLAAHRDLQPHHLGRCLPLDEVQAGAEVQALVHAEAAAALDGPAALQL
mmetsp:Transcript_55907/g.143955  ORF Transcript_55907/g.143955 Transcript_55907/m.143955 type:complete len:202 (+) Transcript_55907:20-625(+)